MQAVYGELHWFYDSCMVTEGHFKFMMAVF